MRRAIIAVALSWALFGSRASADERLITFTLDYAAPEACPDRSEFLNALRTRSKRGAEIADAAPDVALSIELRMSGKRATGLLRLKLEDGQTSERALPEAECADVITSMAVIAAMVIDGGSLDTPLSRPETAPTTTDEATREDAGDDALPEAEPAASRPAPMRREPAAAVPALRAPARPPEQPGVLPVRLGAVLAASLGTARAPSWTVAGSVGLDISARRTDWLSPSARASIAWNESEWHRVPNAGRARYRLIATRWSGCPVRISPLEVLAFRPCALVEVGDLQGTGESTGRLRERHMLWLGFGVAARAEISPAEWLSFELEAREVALMHHDRFVFEGSPSQVVHDVPRLATELGAALVVRLR